MSSQFVRYGFFAGELSPKLSGRSDLEKYDFGCLTALNWVVDYEGGITTRQGMICGEYIMRPDKPRRMFPFQFAADEPNTYMVLFGHQYVRFIQDGAYVIEDPKAITGVSQANPGVVTSAAHGFANGDWGYIDGIFGMSELNDKLFVVAGATTNTFTLTDIFGNVIDTTSFGAWIAGGHFSRIYTLISPFDGDDLAGLHAEQVRDTLRLTHKDYRPRDLTRNDHTDWTIALIGFGNDVAVPTGVVADASDFATSPPGTRTAYAVTAVDRDGNESSQSERGILVDASNILVNPVTYFVDWDYAQDVAYWNVYRSQIQAHTNISPSRGDELGYIGRAYGPHFADQNIIADYTKTPPRNSKPFANREVLAVNVLTGGTGYSETDTIAITSVNGAGFVGFLVVTNSTLSGSSIVGVIVESGGEGYEETDTVVVSGGSGATFEIVIGEKRTNNPRLSATFQQRQIYASTIAKPMTIWGSKPGMLSNFDTAHIIKDDDAYEFEIDSSVVAPIRFLLASRTELLALASTGVWSLTGENGQALTPKNVLAEPQAYTGCLDVQPVRIGNDVLYIEEHACAARLLTYKDQSKAYLGEDISLLSSHLFTPDNQVTKLAFAAAPRKIAWARREDGTLLTFTILREQNLYAWTRAETKGRVKDLAAINEHGFDQVYLDVERYINGETVAFFEYLAPHTTALLEDRVHLDSALQLPVTKPASAVQPNNSTGTVNIVAETPVFGPFDLGKVWRGGGGKGTVTTYTSPSRIKVTLDRDITDFVPQSNDPSRIESGDWTLDELVTVVRGLDHLEGERVWYLADGAVGSAIVTNGQITLAAAASRVTVGLKYECQLQPVPATSQQVPIETRRVRIVKLAINYLESRGLKMGDSFDRMDEIRERTDEAMGDATRLQSGIAGPDVIPSDWGIDKSVCLLQDQPLPATVRALVMDMEIEDIGS